MIRIKISIGIIAAIIVLGAVGFFMLKNETDEIIAMLDETRELSDKGKKEEALESCGTVQWHSPDYNDVIRHSGAVTCEAMHFHLRSIHG
jgi:hypothetical protein